MGGQWEGVENITGTAFADRIGGTGLANLPRCMSGADEMVGQDGTDNLAGGGGKDTLSGGRENDTFPFHRPGDIGDIVPDFLSALTGNNDWFPISASGFGGGQLAGALGAAQFRARADNAAQDAGDRFIFRTTDQTLWFDSDGTGVELAVMVADLQAGASTTFADIVIF